MLTAALVASVIVLLVIPIMGLCVFCYSKERSWKPLAAGVFYLLLIQILLRLVIPAMLYPMDWFAQLVENTTAFSFVYSAMQVILTMLFFMLEIRALRRRNEPESYSALFGFTFGMTQADLFVGFSCLNVLLSSASEIDGLSVANVLYSTAEVLSMMAVYTALGTAVSIWLQKKDWLKIALASMILFVLCGLGYMGTSIYHLPRALIVLLLALAAAACLYWQFKVTGFHFKPRSSASSKPGASR